MHLTPLHGTTKDEKQLLLSCLYKEENRDIFELTERYRLKLAQTYEATHNARFNLHLAAIKRYESFLSDGNLIRNFISDVDTLAKLIDSSYPHLKVEIHCRSKAFISYDNKVIKALDERKSYDSINDIVAFRFLLDSDKLTPEELVYECYSVMNTLIEFYIARGCTLCDASPVQDTIKLGSPILKDIIIPMESRIDPMYAFASKDYILTPKENGYQSLHVIFRMLTGLTFEVQVRTKKMDLFATEGYGHHGNYKEAKYTNCIEYDPRRVNMVGYMVSPKTGKVIEDNSGLEKPIILYSYPAEK